MPNFSNTTLVGHATRDPEMRHLPNGGALATFGIAVNGWKKDAPAMFIDCKAWDHGNRKLAEWCGNQVKKGAAILVNGRLELETWEDKNGGGKRSKHVIIVNEFQLLSGKANTASTQEQPSYSQPTGDLPAPDETNIPF